MAWEIVDGTNVETKTFYMMSDDGKIGMAQVIYSNVMGIRTTAQFNAKITGLDPGRPELWASDNLDKFSFSPDKQDFHATNCSVELSEKGTTYHIKSSLNKNCIVDLKFTCTAPGFQVGKTGSSNFGTDPAKPWGRMRHAFWPRCKVEGQMLTKSGPVNFGGRGMFAHALQGMKPHFAGMVVKYCL